MVMVADRALNAEQAEMLEMVRDAKRIRDAAGDANEYADALLAQYEAGDFPAWSFGSNPEGFGIERGLGRRPEAGARAGNQYGPAQVKFATDPQVRYIANLMRTKDLSQLGSRAAEVVALARPMIEAGKINKRNASDVLDVLVPLPDKPKPVMKGDPNAGRRPNRFGGKCIHCSVYVQAEAGWLTKDESGKWASEHKSGECPSEAERVEIAIPEVPAGRFAILGPDQVVDFYQVDRPEQGKWAGYIFLSLLTGAPGSFNQTAIKNPKAKAQIMGRILDAGVEQSARLFGQKTQTCGHCSSDLTDPQSRASGYGPVCAKKHGYWYASLVEALDILGEGE